MERRGRKQDAPTAQEQPVALSNEGVTPLVVEDGEMTGELEEGVHEILWPERKHEEAK